MDEIRNRVKESGIVAMDLADFKPQLALVEIDLKEQLWQELAIREKDFRVWIKDHDWKQYENCCAYIHCSADAIIPTWAYMLVSSELVKRGVDHLKGSRADLERKLISEAIERLDVSEFSNARIIIKGCSSITDPAFAMIRLMQKLQPVCSSIMYGEPCSSVPVFKRK